MALMDKDDSPVKTHSTTKASDSASTPPLAEIRKKLSTPPSTVWDHFVKIDENDSNDPTFKCNYCGEDFACDISSLWAHLNEKCQNYPYRFISKRQKTVNFQLKKDVVEDDIHSESSSNLLEGEVSREAVVKACAKMLIIDELHFGFVETKGFRNFWSMMAPQHDPPSSLEVARDAMNIYINEKKHLKSLLIRDSQRVSLSTEMWTTPQGLDYMCLTVHFIDSEWKLQKIILNFCHVPDHKSETIGNLIDDCLRDWGIQKVFTIIVDDANSNDGAINYIKKNLKNRNGSVLDGEFLHVQCGVRIVNSIVNDALGDLNDSIDSIRNAVRYVKSCPSTLEKFNACVKQEGIESEGIVVLDVPTMWNTTYKMLEAALKFQRAFERLEVEDNNYANYFLEDEGEERKRGPPMIDDWENARVFVRILKSLYNLTIRLSDYSRITSNIYFHELCSIQSELTEWSQSENSHLTNMALSMKTKYDKWWSSIGDVNQLFLISTVLDPRLKMEYMRWSCSEIYDDSVVEQMVKDTLMRFYEYYSSHPSTSSTEPLNGVNGKNKQEGIGIHSLRIARFKKYLKEVVHKEIKSEVDMYLLETNENAENVEFDVLAWWKFNSTRFQILSQIARDVFAVPVSSVSSASPFSTEPRILSSNWSLCTPKLLEALVCARNWIQTSHSSLKPEDYYTDNEELCEEIESEFLEVCEEEPKHFSIG